MIGALSKYIATPNKKFQPMNANFGIIKPLEENYPKKCDKKKKYEMIADTAIKDIKELNLNKTLHI